MLNVQHEFISVVIPHHVNNRQCITMLGVAVALWCDAYLDGEIKQHRARLVLGLVTVRGILFIGKTEDVICKFRLVRNIFGRRSNSSSVIVLRGDCYVYRLHTFRG